MGQLGALPQVDNPGGCVLFQVLQQQVCHVERSEVVNAHGDFEVVLCSVVRRYENACIVDQYVQRCSAVQESIGEVSNRSARHTQPLHAYHRPQF